MGIYSFWNIDYILRRNAMAKRLFVVFFQSQDEIFDMVKPTDPYRISLQDLVNRLVNVMLYF